MTNKDMLSGLLFCIRAGIEGLAKDLKPKLPGIFGMLLFLSVGVTFLLGARTDPYLHNNFYDSSNTLNIARQPVGDLLAILKYEQNFPLYYLFLHALFSLFGFNARLPFVANFIVWVLSIVLFRKTLGLVVKDKAWASLFTVLYTWIPQISPYSYYARMYGVINLLVICELYLFLRKYVAGNISTQGYVFLQASVLTLIALLHPQSVLFLALLLAANFLVFARSGKSLLLNQALVAGALLFAVVSIVTKPAFLAVYKGGLEYTSELQQAPYYFFDLLLFGGYFGLSVLTFVLYIYTLFVFAKAYFELAPYRVVMLPAAFLLGLSVATSQLSQPRHYIFLVAPVLLAFFWGLYSLEGKRRLLLVASVAVYFFVVSVAFLFQNIADMRFIEQAFCRNVGKLSGQNIVTDFAFVNAVDYCSNGSNKIFMINPGKQLEAKSALSEKELLFLQADYGGTRGHFYALETTARTKDMLSKGTYARIFSGSALPPQFDAFYYVPTTALYDRLFLSELAYFRNYRLTEVVGPSIFRFERIGN